MSEAAIACRVCGAASPRVYSGRVLGHDVDYHDCSACGYFQTETPHWLEQAYSAAINDVDTGILWRNQRNLRRVVMTLAAFGQLQGRVVDHAGGYGNLHWLGLMWMLVAWGLSHWAQREQARRDARGVAPG